ncbi:hypothetical protein AC480_01315 [miscellaneous Crenarchaeota group archaeon SMTZ1-55]|nr:MAG: hypothetical protein AC480_01315 [miscellaneous Crenarchaeota group archaeon SMTZ1-55]
MTITTVSVIGVGTLGKQIAERAALCNYEVHVFDVNPRGLREFVQNVQQKVRAHGSTGELTIHDTLADAVSTADLIVEAVPEKLELKRAVFAQIDQAAPSHAIIATNSSSIPVSRLEDAVKRPDKVLNIHFYKIPDQPMADVARGTATSDDTFEAGLTWVRSLEITPLVVKKECLGFVFNRVWRAIKKECLHVWAGGYAEKEAVDRAWKIFTGMSQGPFELMDAVGLDVVYDIEMMYYRDSGDPRDQPPQRLKAMVDRGDLGVKSGKGFYHYE